MPSMCKGATQEATKMNRPLQLWFVYSGNNFFWLPSIPNTEQMPDVMQFNIQNTPIN